MAEHDSISQVAHDARRQLTAKTVSPVVEATTANFILSHQHTFKESVNTASTYCELQAHGDVAQ